GRRIPLAAGAGTGGAGRGDRRATAWLTERRGIRRWSVRLGYSLSYWGTAGLSPAEHLTLVREAERLGYHSAWAAETYGTDPASLVAWLAGQTRRIRLGTAIL